MGRHRAAGTATDVLRVLYVLSGADPGLRTPPARRAAPSRAVRRAVLGRLEATPYLVEDLLRHAGELPPPRRACWTKGSLTCSRPPRSGRRAPPGCSTRSRCGSGSICRARRRSWCRW
ncbi:hypothetical protein ACU635_20025 [[Actinomadura] parvosata]|uniref:hypothetical protein n=1 Tax=[Actinomadura] parvosata TaxID=1955412 RepID=UPI00406CD03E